MHSPTLLLFVSGILFSLVQAAFHPYTRQYAKTQTILNGRVQIAWTVDNKTETLQLGLQSSGTGYIALGIGAQMKNADMVIGWVDSSGSVVIHDYWSTGHSTPLADTTKNPQGQDNVKIVSGKEVSGNTILEFDRPLGKSDQWDNAIDLSSPVRCIGAYDASRDSVVEHKPNHFGGFSVNFVTGAVTQHESGDKGIIVHGVFMFLAWPVFITLASFLPRFLKDVLGPAWFWLHIALNMLGLFLMFVAFCLALAHVPDDESFSQDNFLDFFHAWLGLFVVIAGFAQPLVGSYADYKWNPNRIGTPIWPDQIHWWVGRAAMAGAFLNCFTGIYMFGSPVWISLYVIYSIAVLGVFVMFYFRSNQAKQAKVNHDFFNELDEEE